MKATAIEQNNIYNVKDGMGRSTDFYVRASNIKEACQEVKRIAREEKRYLPMYYKVQRCYNGGVRG